MSYDTCHVPYTRPVLPSRGLTSQLSFEQPGTWQRRLTRTLPAGSTTGAPTTAKATSAYYGDAETAPAVCGLASTTRQYGLLKSVTGPQSATGPAIVIEYAYDVMGRTVATKTTGDTDWSCTTYDSRGRVTQQTTVGGTGVPTKTLNTGYDATTAGLRVRVTDPSLTSTTTEG